MRFRHVFLLIGGSLALLLSLIGDPTNSSSFKLPFGEKTFVTLLILLFAIIYIGFLHLARKGLLDYLDLEELFNNAKKTPEGSGLATIAVGLIMISISIIISAVVR